MTAGSVAMITMILELPTTEARYLQVSIKVTKVNYRETETVSVVTTVTNHLPRLSSDEV